MADLPAAYRPAEAIPPPVPIVVTRRMWPEPWARRWGSTAWVTQICPRTLTSKWARIWVSVASSTMPYNIAAALLATMSSLPNAATARSTLVHRGAVGDVERNARQGVGMAGPQALQRRHVTGRGHDAISPAQRSLRERPAQPPGRARDEPRHA